MELTRKKDACSIRSDLPVMEKILPPDAATEADKPSYEDTMDLTSSSGMEGGEVLSRDFVSS